MKKRVLSLLLVLLMVVSLVPISALADKSNTDVAYAVEGGNIYFDKATGTITDCDDGVTEAIIPAEIGGVKVTSIGEVGILKLVTTSLTSVDNTEQRDEHRRLCILAAARALRASISRTA